MPCKFGEVWLSIPKVINVMHWNNTVSTSPERWKCGPSLKQHWGSALPPSYMCDWAVRTDKAGRQDWESNYQHYIDIGSISFFFCFFFTVFLTVSTSPERWKCGPSLKQHWGSALPPSYMCDWAVRTDKAGRQDWESNYQHYIDIGSISFFFCFFFKIWYLAENKREKIAFAKYPLLREM